MFKVTHYIHTIPQSFDTMNKFVPDSINELENIYRESLKDKFHFLSLVSSKIVWAGLPPNGCFLVTTDDLATYYIDLYTLNEDIRNKKIELIFDV